ncbi:LysR family transcriptional regulator [Reinekea sp.]|jgi:DNA-binding transcriptional LysR family regulator|uniref:LysR family transcriptional regulator n=1 Tax=Reinekea sp. TaxID=1970455 RepID=UPI003989F274
MEIRALKYFVSAFETRSITAASLQCHVAQPSISQAIQKLEGELECILFTRNKTGVTPTKAGKMLYQHAKNLLADRENIIEMFKPATRRTRKTVSLNVHLPLSRFNAVLDVLGQKLSQYQWQFEQNQEGADILICTQYQCPESFEFIPLWKDSYRLLVPNSTRIDFTSQGLGGLEQIEFIERPFCENHALWTLLQKKLDIKLTVSAQAPSEEWAQLMVAKGFGACFAPAPSEPIEGIQTIDLACITDIDIPTRTIGWAIAPSFDDKSLFQ